jgi:CheY-like chemotaxis protein
MKIMIVDPDWCFLQQARGYLESRGHHTIYEPHAQSALERAGHWHPDALLVSAELEEVADGTLLERLAALRPRPALLLTAALERFDKAWRAWQHGGDEVLFKPMLNTSELNVALFNAMENAVCPARRPVHQTGNALSA